MFKFNKLLVVAAFALASALGQNAFAENTDIAPTNPTETTISVLNEATSPELPAIEDALETDGEFIIIEDAIIGEELSVDELQGLITKVQEQDLCTSRSCANRTPRCPACRIFRGINPTGTGQCRQRGRIFRCQARRGGR